MQLTKTIKRQLETDMEFLTSRLRQTGRAKPTVLLDEDSGEVLITLLMTNEEICIAIRNAVKEVFGDEYMVSDIYMGCGKRLFTFKISKKNC